ncbi:alkaline phosphatase family protein [Ammoniphilus sp. YIM 78166]|uniref:alkaline phosphatase family protein n=1 Tax=Ammoniphilus sp. YIM 78166 TaxID=1644106 RepID=UPI00106FE394|nr:alkaline phosphatase family protein [Ammoniphilus sp. YIM 78166]
MKKVFLMFTLFCFLLVMSGCGLEPRPFHIQTEATGSKKVILIIVDSLIKNPLTTMMEERKLPAFRFLKEKGWYTDELVSVFPTMSVVIESTLLTGHYPNHHGVPGLRWYDVEERKLVNYGDGTVSSIRSGAVQTAMNGLLHLNNTHLNQDLPTIHEELASMGKPTASINALVYRGSEQKTLHVPGMAPLATMAPPYFVLGSFHHYVQTGFTHRFFPSYGVNDRVSVDHLLDLIQNKALPDFTIMYMPDLDKESHEEGINTKDTIVKVDQLLQEVLHAFGTWEEALRDHVFIVMGDSGFSRIGEDKAKSVIPLDTLFQPLKIAEPDQTTAADDLAVAVNSRMAYVYPLRQDLDMDQVVEMVKKDARVDMITRRRGEWIEVMHPESGQQLRYRPGLSFTDVYSQTWDIEGEESVLDLDIDTRKKQIGFGKYPDALMQLYAAAHSHSGDYFIMTTAPGYEMEGAHSPIHPGGGNHGSLHKEDLLIPMFVAGTDKRPKTLRVVDLKPFILGLLKQEG